MKYANITVVAVAIVVGLSTAAPAASTKHRAARAPAPSATQSYEARYAACRTEAFRRFGWHYGDRLVLYSDFAVTQVDYCMRNGGHF
jgi:hypothetical protein